MAEDVRAKVLLVGWDAADWKLIRPLMDGGRMPHLARLVREGVSGDLASLEPMLSPILWTSIATGKRPHKHGIHGFTEPTPDGRGIRAAASTSRTAKALWNILTQCGLRTHQIGWYASHPAEPIRGVSVSNYYAVAPPPGAPWTMAEGAIHPAGLRDALASLQLRPEELRAADLQFFIPGVDRIDPAKDLRPLKCAVILAETATTHNAATWVMEHEPWDFMAVLYDGIDHFCHLFMEYCPPRQPQVGEGDFETYSRVVSACYEFHDMMLGRLLELAGEDVMVLVLSDHGFRSGEERLRQTEKTLEGLSRWHRKEGMFVMHGPGVRVGALVEEASLLDVTPTVLTLFGLAIGRDMDGRPWLEAIKGERTPTHIDSWDQVPGEAGQHPPHARISPGESLAAVRHLIELGYLAPPNADMAKTVEQCRETNDFNLARALVDTGLCGEAVEILQRLVSGRPEEEPYKAALQKARHKLECE